MDNFSLFKQKLEKLPEDAQFQEIELILEENALMGLKLANSLLTQKTYFEKILDKGLIQANASDIEIWLKYLIARLGFKHIVAILSNKLSDSPTTVAKASYWLPKFLPKDNEKAQIMLKNLLKKEKKMLGQTYKPAQSSGKTYQLILKIKKTGEYAIFGGYPLGSKGKTIIVEILDSQDLSPTGGVKEMSPSEIEIMDPQPYSD